MMNIKYCIQVIHKIFWSLIQMVVYPFTTYLNCRLDKLDCLSAAIIKDMTEKLRDVLQDQKNIKEYMDKIVQLIANHSRDQKGLKDNADRLMLIPGEIDTKMEAVVKTLSDFQIQLKKIDNDVEPLMLIPEEIDTKMDAIVTTLCDFQIQLKKIDNDVEPLMFIPEEIDTKMDAIVTTMSDFQIKLKKIDNNVKPLMFIPEEIDTKMDAIVTTMSDFQIKLKKMELVGQKLVDTKMNNITVKVVHNSRLQKSSRMKRVSKRKGNRPKQVNCNLLNYDEKSHLDLPENVIPVETTGAIKKKQVKGFFGSMKQKLFRKKKEKFEESWSIASSSSEIASPGDNLPDSGSVDSIPIKDISKKVGKKGLSLKSVFSSCRKKEKK